MTQNRSLDKLVKQEVCFVESLIELMPGYLINVTEDYQKLSESIVKKDVIGVQQVVHRVRGSAISYGFSVIDTIMDNIQILSQDDNFKLMDEQAAGLKQYLKNIKKALEDRGE
ncbi:MAG: hypothetical protein HN353_11810 [Bdellovibrionales bacterium]|jgi:hypothetical protein|nr:hypothetical protein [Bdellovibrionales bacterium]MBT3526835.1 hypothetical protein [Bdellovibrionales bacterium]MBT7668291.1 hypothetical protein [Bdellovibrionales bacterium]MBT7767102.1 hypothetical protein [Bdellovibrionales bacterium]